MVTPVLSSVPVQQFLQNGIPISGGKLFTYAAGTATKQATYTDATGLTQNTNPIIINSNGYPQNGSGQTTGIWLDPSLSYKFVLSPSTDTDPPTNPIWTVDNISGSDGVLSAIQAITGAALIGVEPAGTVQDVVNPTLNMLSVLPNNAAAMSGLHLTAGDSLTNGVSTTWRTNYAAVMRANFGYGGPGYIACANAKMPGYYHTPNVVEFNIGDGSSYATNYGPYSPSGEGLVMFSTGDYFFGLPSGAWSLGGFVFYQTGPTMGAFQWQFTSGGSGYTTVDCYSATPGMGVLVIPPPPVATSCGLQFQWIAGTTNPTGPCSIFGWHLKHNTTGYLPGDLSHGGRTLQNWALQNSTAQALFYATVQPSVIWFDFGMNDRATRTAANHYADLATCTAFMQSGAPTANIIMAQSLEPIDALTTYFESYTAQKIAICEAYNLAFMDERISLGLRNYAVANSLGYMIGDGIHPNPKCNIGRAQIRVKFLGCNPALTDPGVTAYSGGSGSVKVPSGTLTEQDNIALPAPVAAATGGTASFATNVMTCTVAPTAGAFAVGQAITGTNVPANTVITSLGTGTGGTGTYNLSTSPGTIAAEAVTGYTTTRVVLWKIGLTNGSPTAKFEFKFAGQRMASGALNCQKLIVGLNNGTTLNQVNAVNSLSSGYSLASGLFQELTANAGDGNNIQYIIDVTINGSTHWAEIGITATRYGGTMSATGSYLFSSGIPTGQSVFQN